MPLNLSPRLIAGGFLVYSGVAVGTFLYLRKPSPAACGGAKPGDGGDVFDTIAPSYDRSIDLDETLMGVKLLRRWLVRQAQGNVLEVSAGTGRNLSYYDPQHVRSLTVTDRSREMLRAAYDKSRELRAPVQQTSFALSDCAKLCDAQATGWRADAGAAQRPALDALQAYPPASFDTVVETFGLCSHSDPVAALKEMGRVCKPDGRILLLEHGRSHYGLINRLLDDGAEQHASKWGCHWNRDISDFVAQAGLQVEEVSRYHFGTTYRIVARPATRAE